MESPLPITYLNDFIFCPVSIYFHSLDNDADRIAAQDTAQLNGSASHERVDHAEYSDRKSILQGISVYCEKYGLFGVIDVLDTENGVLTERKKKIKTIYDGYVFQVYAQYFALTEMGYTVKRIRLHSMDDNRNYDLLLPEDDVEMLAKFEYLIREINGFEFDGFRQTNPLKCRHCIYEPLCSFTAGTEVNR